MNTPDAKEKLPEIWLRGPVPDMPALLQPLAHALLQAQEELNLMLADFPEHLLWLRPVGVASVGFHLQHLTGVLNRLFTYAQGKQLTDAQLSYLQAEGHPGQTDAVLEDLLDMFNTETANAIQQLKDIDAKVLTEMRRVGRAGLPSTVIGLYVHAAEHTMRHIGQLLVTVRILQAAGTNPALAGLIE